MYKYLTLLALFVHGIQGQVPLLGKCPEVEGVQENFNLTRYMGKWINTEKYFIAFEVAKRCGEAVYTLNEDGSMGFLNQMTRIISKTVFNMHGTGTLIGDPTEAKLYIKFTDPLPFEGPYWILETDYDSYSVVWSCTDVIGFHTEMAWILTRERDYAPEVLEKAHAVFDRSNLSTSLLSKMDQTDCPSYDDE